jgi:hypothetical protein
VEREKGKMIFRLRNQDKNSLRHEKKEANNCCGYLTLERPSNPVRNIHVAIKKVIFNLLSVSRQHCG